MELVGRSRIVDWLYCLNWHMGGMVRELRENNTLTKRQRKELSQQICCLNKLKTDVLLKVLSEGYASVRGMHMIQSAHFCLRLGRNNTFHIRVNARTKEAIRAYEEDMDSIRNNANQTG